MHPFQKREAELCRSQHPGVTYGMLNPGRLCILSGKCGLSLLGSLVSFSHP